HHRRRRADAAAGGHHPQGGRLQHGPARRPGPRHTGQPHGELQASGPALPRSGPPPLAEQRATSHPLGIPARRLSREPWDCQAQEARATAVIFRPGPHSCEPAFQARGRLPGAPPGTRSQQAYHVLRSRRPPQESAEVSALKLISSAKFAVDSIPHPPPFPSKRPHCAPIEVLVYSAMALFSTVEGQVSPPTASRPIP